LKQEDRRHLDKYFTEAAPTKTDMERLCKDYLYLGDATCNALQQKNIGYIDSYELANKYLQQKPEACWEDIVKVFHELSRNDLALKVNKRHVDNSSNEPIHS
jgi:hypothetical protein